MEHTERHHMALPNMKRALVIILNLVLFSPLCVAEVYFYLGPDGERMATDRPPHASQNYELLVRRDSMTDAGHILADWHIPVSDMSRIRHYIDRASEQFNIDPALVEAVVQVESGFNPNAVSKKGATGLMQLMSATARQYDVRDRFDPRQNIFAGVRHLSELMRRFDGELPIALAAYNAGSRAVERYHGIPPYPETQDYVRKVMNYHNMIQKSRYVSSRQ